MFPAVVESIVNRSRRDKKPRENGQELVGHDAPRRMGFSLREGIVY